MKNLNVRRQRADVRRKKPFGSEGAELPTGGSGVQHPGNQWFTHHASRITYCLLLTAACILVFSGCEQTFQPLQENNTAPFSIFGYLDASADTQWLRVTPVRRQLNLQPVVPEMEITIEDLQSGETAVMNSTLKRSPDGFHILNAWAVTDILKPEHTCRVRAERPDGAASHVTVTFPEDFPTPSLQIVEIVSRAFVNIRDVDRLLTVQTRTRVRIISESAGWDYVDVFSIAHRDVRYAGPNDYRVQISLNRAFSYVRGRVPDPPRDDLQIEILNRQIFVAAAGPDWNEELTMLDDRNYSLPNVVSNVENGTGYVFGIVSKSIPFHSCFDDQGELIACPEETPFQ